jgi:hypothetical protein
MMMPTAAPRVAPKKPMMLTKSRAPSEKRQTSGIADGQRPADRSAVS